MLWAIDLLASEYGWAKNDILEKVYFDELFVFTRLINTRKLQDYKMRLAIAQNPHVKNPQELWHILEKQEGEITGRSYLDAEFDSIGFDALKLTLQRHSKGIVVK